MVSSISPPNKPQINLEMIAQILGSSAVYFNQDLSPQRLENVNRILLKTQEKFLECTKQKGQIPPKMVRSLINEGSFADDKVAIDYFAGILASSRNKIGRDDRGISMAKLVDNLSCYQLRSHFLIYSTIRSKFKDKRYHFEFDDCERMEIFLPTFFYAKAMKMNKDEFNQVNNLAMHSIQGLANHNLIDKNFYFGYPEHHHQYFKGFDFEGIICQPTKFGVQLFLWAFGAGNENIEFLFHEKFKPKIKGLPGKIPHVLYTQP
tara:strand:+ start:2581 stop:3366 length:786 start_codon:yes stop_codon:yes gene_type:complete